MNPLFCWGSQNRDKPRNAARATAVHQLIDRPQAGVDHPVAAKKKKLQPWHGNETHTLL